MSSRSSRLLVDDMWEAVCKIQRYTAGMSHSAFVGDEMATDAVIRNLEVIGEAANRLPEAFKKDHASVEWHKIVGLRHRIVHEYFGVDLDIVWRILEDDLPLFRQELESIRTGFTS
jgi:uncharacterized protein with HEPN domain